LELFSEAGDVIAAVDKGDFAGDAAGQVAGEEEGGVADLESVDVAMERAAFFDGVEDLAEVADASGGEGFDWACGDGVDANFFCAEVGGEVADGGFQSGFCDAHDVVVGEDLFSAVVGEGEDGAALGHEWLCAAGEGDEGVDADVVGDAEVVALGVEDVVLDVGSEADGVDEDVDLSIGGFELLEDGVDVGVDGDVAAEGFGAGEIGGELFGFALEALVLVADGEGGAAFGELLGDTPGDAAFVGEAEDDGDFAFEVDHVGGWLLFFTQG
jgi:hypothetical protein